MQVKLDRKGKPPGIAAGCLLHARCPSGCHTNIIKAGEEIHRETREAYNYLAHTDVNWWLT